MSECTIPYNSLAHYELCKLMTPSECTWATTVWWPPTKCLVVASAALSVVLLFSCTFKMHIAFAPSRDISFSWILAAVRLSANVLFAIICVPRAVHVYACVCMCIYWHLSYTSLLHAAFVIYWFV